MKNRSQIDRDLHALESIEDHVGAAAIAAKIGVSKDVIGDEMTRGKLPYVMIGRRRVVPVSAVTAYIAQRAIGNHPLRAAKPASVTSIADRPRRRAATS